jgi:hypothetical protein
MKNPMKATFVSFLLMAGLSASALEIENRFTTPMVSHRPDINDAERNSVDHLLKYMNETITFIEGGRAPHMVQVQRFGGSATDTSNFIGLLKSAGLWEVQVRFRDFGEQESAFLLIEHSSPALMTVEVNSGREDYLLKHFTEHLPQSESGVATEAQHEAEQGAAEQPATAGESK